MRILVFAAHPDDETIMAGGLIHSRRVKGDVVRVAFMTLNEEAHFGKTSRKERVKRTRAELAKSSSLLGFEPRCLGFEDMAVSSDRRKLLKTLVEEIRTFKPDIIITHNDKDWHDDHRILGQIMGEANFQAGCCVCGGETRHSAPLILHGEVDLESRTAFLPDIVFQLDEAEETMKEKAFMAYGSVDEEHGKEQQETVELIRTRARLRGLSAGARYGEAFEISRSALLNKAAAPLARLMVKE